VLNVPQVKLADKHVTSVRKRVTTIKDELGRDVSTDEVKNSIAKGIEIAYNVRLQKGDLTGEELALAKELYDEKYSRAEWNLER
jgi:lipoate-protein ligase A